MAKVEQRNCPKTSIGSNLEPQKSTKEGEEALFRCSGGPKMEAPEAALDPFRTVSLGFSVNRGNPLLDSFVICGHCHSRSTLVRIVLGKGEA